ncbi:hypothetical protein P4H71_26185 [Paenibacillus kribbensis]|uniref:hypothetical protein n=1 Tax=Paenibacillus kribbensis TaxID=172713 RepID=UPI002DBA783C|nr:hypothetical protein [Paenibacillus kribbensis]MEC0237811.1 hypothetical protein [Paenibacillus kribbensis]
MSTTEFNRHGNHVFLTTENAQETIELAINHIEEDARHKARSKAFEDCTAYWRTEIEKIHAFGGPPRAQLSRILNLFEIEVRED